MDELERGEKMDLQNPPLVRPSEMVDVEAGQINDKAAEILEEEEDDEEETENENDENVLPANKEVLPRRETRRSSRRRIRRTKKSPTLFSRFRTTRGWRRRPRWRQRRTRMSGRGQRGWRRPCPTKWITPFPISE